MYAIVALACYFSAGVLMLQRQLAGGPEAHPHGIGPALLMGAAGLAMHSVSLAGLVTGHPAPELSLGAVLSLVGWLLALFALAGAIKPRFRLNSFLNPFRNSISEATTLLLPDLQ